MSLEETCQHKVIVMFVNSVYLYSWTTAAIPVSDWVAYYRKLKLWDI